MARHTPPALLALAFPLVAHAQLLVNGDFESHDLPPWVLSNTAHGTSILASINVVDIDGGGPLTSSYCLAVMVGQAAGAAPGAPEGVILQQTVTLQAGAGYDARFDWGARCNAATAPSPSAGIFDLLLDGVSFAQVSAPYLSTPPQQAHGFLSAVLTPAQSGPHQVGVRIARTVPVSNQQMLYVDNFTLRAHCALDLDNSGAIDPGDVAFFINTWFASLQTGTLAGDFDGGGTVDPADVASFVLAWLSALHGNC